MSKLFFNHCILKRFKQSYAIGIGFTSASESGIWNIFPDLIRTVFAENVVAVVFVIAIVLNLLLPADMDIKKVED